MTITDQIARVIDSISEIAHGKTVSECIRQGICCLCGGEAKRFKSEITLREYKLSGLCENCQKKNNSVINKEGIENG